MKSVVGKYICIQYRQRIIINKSIHTNTDTLLLMKSISDYSMPTGLTIIFRIRPILKCRLGSEKFRCHYICRYTHISYDPSNQTLVMEICT